MKPPRVHQDTRVDWKTPRAHGNALWMTGMFLGVVAWAMFRDDGGLFSRETCFIVCGLAVLCACCAPWFWGVSVFRYVCRKRPRVDIRATDVPARAVRGAEESRRLLKIFRVQMLRSGIPVAMLDRLSEKRSVRFSGGLTRRYTYHPRASVVRVPKTTLKRIEDKSFTPGEAGGVYNELFHAFWHTVIFSEPDNEWLRSLLREEAVQYDENREMLEEAMSETVDRIAVELTRKTIKAADLPWLHGMLATGPMHAMPGEKWSGMKMAGKKMSRSAYYLMLYLFYFGDEKPKAEPGVKGDFITEVMKRKILRRAKFTSR